MSGLGENIRAYRISNGLDQGQLGELVGVSDKTVSSWEVGRTEPKMGMIERICEALHCQKSDLIENYEKKKVPTYVEGTVELIDMFSKVTPEQRKAVLNLLRSFTQE